MMRNCTGLLFSLTLLSAAAAQAADAGRPAPTIDLLASTCQWQPMSNDQLTMTSERGETLKITTQTNGGDESFPLMRLNFDQPQDWRRFHTLTLQASLAGDRPGMFASGKRIAVCLYSETLLNQDGKPAQQIIAQPRIRDNGQQQEFDLDFGTAPRGAVTAIEVIFHEQPYYTMEHQFTLDFSKLLLTGYPDDQQVMDGVGFEPSGAPAEAGPVAGSIRTGNGLKLEFTQSGLINAVSVKDQPVYRGNNAMSGILLRKPANRLPPQPAGGTLSIEGNRAVQTMRNPAENLAMQVVYEAKEDHIAVDGWVAGIDNDKPLPVTVYCALPLQPEQTWDFGTSLNNVVKIDENYRIEESVVQFPLATVGDADASITMAIRLDEPTAYHLVINPDLDLFYTAFDFSLINQPNVRGGSMNKADFSLVIYPNDPDWGFRSACDTYYRLFPQFFVDRIGHGGGWGVPWLDMKAQEKGDAGLRFNWDSGSSRDKLATFRRNNTMNFIYIEPEFFQYSLGDSETPNDDDAERRLHKLASGDPDEWKAYEKLHYAAFVSGQPYSPLTGMTTREFLQAVMAAVEVSAQHNRDGQVPYDILNRVSWIGDSGMGAMIPCNLNPLIPGGKGMFGHQQNLAPLVEELEQEAGFPIDGFGLDCFGMAPADYRFENFKYASMPISYDRQTLQPMLPAPFGSVEWLKYMAETFHPQKKYFIANIFGPLTFLAPYLDIFGAEKVMVTEPELYRMLAGPRTVSFLPWGKQPPFTYEYHLFWDMYPGSIVDEAVLKKFVSYLDLLYAAQWQPLTLARTDNGIPVERYGNPDDEVMYFTLLNREKTARPTILQLDDKLALPAGTRFELIYPTTAKLEQENRRLTLDIPAESAAIVKISRAIQP